MKTFFTLLSFCFIFQVSLTAQLTIDVSGTVTDPMNSPLSDVTITIWTDSFPNSPGYWNQVMTDSNGNYFDSFDVSGNQTQGIVYVEMTNCPGNAPVTQILGWSPNNTSLTADFVFCGNTGGGCSVIIGVDSVGGTNGLLLTAGMMGSAPFSYQWSTGENTAGIIISQSGTYCVTATDSNGCTATDCVTLVIVDPANCQVTIQPTPAGVLVAGPGGGVQPYTFLWSTGETTQNILPNASGQYCVTLTDANGCVASDCYFFNPGGDTLCSVAINLLLNQPPLGDQLEAVPSGEAPFSYLWNTQETTSVISPLQSGLYCVTLTDNSGCMASACTFFQSPGGDTLCTVNILAQQIFGTTAYTLTAQVTGAQPFQYLWNTGEMTASIVAQASGTYCVTIADSNGCTATSCITLITNPTNTLISGFVFPSDSINIPMQLEGMAYLIVYDSVAGTLTAVDTVDLFSTPMGTWYDFGQVSAGDYLVKVALSPSSPGYATNLPTYYGDVLFWNDATTISIPDNSGQTSYNIWMVGGVNPGGPGFIGGLVSQGANFAGPGDPLPGVSVLLLNESEEGVTHTLTDEGGYFTFDNLPWGTYQLVVEIIGKEQGIKWVTIGPDNPAVDGIVFEVNEENITTAVKETAAWLNSGDLRVFPNPGNATLNLMIRSPEVTLVRLEMIDIHGQRVLLETMSLTQGENRQLLPTDRLPEGIYLVRLTDGANATTTKWIKQ